MQKKRLEKMKYVRGKTLSKVVGRSSQFAGVFLKYLEKDGIVEIWSDGKIPTYFIRKREEFIEACQRFSDGKMGDEIQAYRSEILTKNVKPNDGRKNNRVRRTSQRELDV